MQTINRHLDHGFQRGQSPTMIVVHSMGETIDSEPDYEAHEWLDKLGLSAHALVAPNGDVIRCRDDLEGAYHAKGHNQNSLGVEFLVEGLHTYASFMDRICQDWVTQAQYEAGVELVKDWLSMYPISELVRHSDISPGRKKDPGTGFPWVKFLIDVRGHE